MINNKLTDAELAKLRADAQRMVDLNSPVSDREWWLNCLAAMVELEECRKASKELEDK
ncbi:hypothetical protein [Buttiauxella brennerae]|uniref:hypothetical protein n=1 Tax=Buttiauxella brennerae TaxID=82988 RepID=UPI00286F9FC5|nr:hypothetical protein [Buttiauxella brennerae]